MEPTSKPKVYRVQKSGKKFWRKDAGQFKTRTTFLQINKYSFYRTEGVHLSIDTLLEG